MTKEEKTKKIMQFT